MTPAVAGNASQAARQYQAAATHQDAVLTQALRGATVTSRSLGLSLGKFGLSYESTDISLKAGEDPAQARAGRIFSDAVEISRLYETLAARGSGPDRTAQAEDSPVTRRQGLAAYSRQSAQNQAQIPAMLSVLV